MNKIIVFGANGYIGSHLVYKLESQNKKVVAIGSSKISRFNFKNYLSVDITNEKEINTIDLKVDVIYFLSAKTGTLDSFENWKEYVLTNEIGLLNILEKLKNLKKKPTFIYPSSRLIYDGSPKNKLKEEAIINPKTVYAVNKVACEAYIKAFNNLYDIPYNILRICVPYGNQMNELYSYGTIGFFLKKATQNKNITLYGSGLVSRTFSHIIDIINVLSLLGEKKHIKHDVFNLGSNDNLSLKEAAKVISNHYNIDLDFIPWPNESLKIETGDTVFDGSKLEKLLDYNYQGNFKSWVDSLPKDS